MVSPGRSAALLPWLLLTGCVLRAGADADGGARDGGQAGPADAAFVCSPPSSSPGLLHAVRTPSAPAVDGRPEEAVWERASPVSFSDPERSDNEVTVLALWDRSALYFSWRVVDGSLELKAGTELYLDDGAELYLDTAHDETADFDEDDYHLVTNYEDAHTGETVAVSTATTGDGYTQEIEIPWTELPVGSPPAAEAILGLLLGNNDRDDGVSVQFDWTGVVETGDYSQPMLWGDLQLSECRP